MANFLGRAGPAIKTWAQMLHQGFGLADVKLPFVVQITGEFARLVPPSPLRLRYHTLPFVARRTDWCAVEEICVNDEYGFVAAVLASLDRPTVLDLGANIGLFGLFVFAQNARAVVNSFEPARDTFDLLQYNVGLNSSYNWHPHETAIFDFDGHAPLERTRTSTRHHLDLHRTSRENEVRTHSFRKLLESFPAGIDVVKMDIEGSEERSLREAGDALDRVIHLIVEVHPNRCNAQAVVDTLVSGFPLVHAVGGRRSRKPLLLASRRSSAAHQHPGVRPL